MRLTFDDGYLFKVNQVCVSICFLVILPFDSYCLATLLAQVYEFSSYSSYHFSVEQLT